VASTIAIAELAACTWALGASESICVAEEVHLVVELLDIRLDLGWWWLDLDTIGLLLAGLDGDLQLLIGLTSSVHQRLLNGTELAKV
jgi:hypothetical protein